MYCSENIIRAIKSRWNRWAGDAAALRKFKNVGTLSNLKMSAHFQSENLKERLLWKPWYTCKDPKIDLKEHGCEGMDWTQTDQDRVKWQVLKNSIMNLWVPYNWDKHMTSHETNSFQNRILLLAIS